MHESVLIMLVCLPAMHPAIHMPSVQQSRCHFRLVCSLVQLDRSMSERLASASQGRKVLRYVGIVDVAKQQSRVSLQVGALCIFADKLFEGLNTHASLLLTKRRCLTFLRTSVELCYVLCRCA